MLVKSDRKYIKLMNLVYVYKCTMVSAPMNYKVDRHDIVGGRYHISFGGVMYFSIEPRPLSWQSMLCY